VSDSSLGGIEGITFVVLGVSFALALVVRKLRNTRPGFDIAIPLTVAVGIRLLAIAGIASTGLSSTLRGGDEHTFLANAAQLANTPWGTGFLPHGMYRLHTVLFAIEMKAFNFSQGAMRITQVGLAMLGAVLVLAAVYDLAGGRAAKLAAWLIAIEPASIFFDSALHKDPLMELAGGLVVFGGTKLWQRLDVRGIIFCALGGAIAVETRSYAGWFLVSAAVLLLLHAALRNMDRPLRSMPLIYGVAIIAFVATPVLLEASSPKNLQVLQASQNANATGAGMATTSGPNGDNLALEEVNFSSRGAILSNLPQRIRDLILQPYPWRLADASQRFGAIGTLIAYAILVLLARYAWLCRGHVFRYTAPLLYPMFFLLVAYALAVGNAGTGFRYRTHLVTLGIATLAVLREKAVTARARRTAAAPSEAADERREGFAAPSPA
jgi:hypothetical protein